MADEGDEQPQESLSTESSGTKEVAEKAKQVTNTAKNVGKEMLKGKGSMLAPLVHILVPCAGCIFFFIIIVGIIMFFLTMPGMIMEKLKALFETLGDYVAAFYGADTTQQIEETDIYDVLDYLEEMGIDIKGEGFLTDYKTTDDITDSSNQYLDEEVGVIRSTEDDTIVDASSDFIYIYMVSDNYVYTLKNNNLATQSEANGFFEKLGTAIKTAWYRIGNFFFGDVFDFLGVTDSKYDAYGKGLIAIYKEESFGVRGSFFNTDTITNWDSIKIDTDNKTLKLTRRELFNFDNAIEYSLDGWTGRYGMPLEFLISVHMATNKPDLAYDMATSFNTNVNLILHKVDDAEVGAMYKTDTDSATFDEIKQYYSGGSNKKNALKAIVYLNLSGSPDCTGPDGNDTGTEEESSGKSWTNTTTEKYNSMIDTFEELGYDGSELKHEISSADELIDYLNDVTEEKNESFDASTTTTQPSDEHNHYVSYYTGTFSLSWTGEHEGEETKYYTTVTISYYHKDYKEYTYYYETGVAEYSSIECDVTQLDISYSEITRDWTQTEWDTALDDAKKNYTEEELADMTNEQILGDIKCADVTVENLENGDFEKCCDNCLAWLKSIYKELDSVADNNFNYYVPYIESVTDHWYRDVYFVSQVNYKSGTGPDMSNSFVDYDYEYEAIMNERWTLYEVDSNGEYVLYEIKDDGSYGDVYDGTAEEAEKEGISVAKKAETITSSALEDLGWNYQDGIYIAYELQSDSPTSTGWEQLYPDDEDELKQAIYYNINSDQYITQTGEGQRTETNNEIKKMFLNNKYFSYSGDAEVAEIITSLRKEVAKEAETSVYYGDVNDYQGVSIKDENGKTITVADYSSTVSLEQDSLSAFSMLENTHTLDADYIYRDFKELIVELGYFTKEELTDETPTLLQFLVPDIGSAGYPDNTLDKDENEYGTMIHSKGDINANKRNTLVELFKEEETYGTSDADLGNSDDEPDNDPDNSSANLNTNSYALNANTNALTGLGSITGSLRTDIVNNVGATEFTKDTLIETATACWQYIVDNGSRYSYAGASIPVSNGNTVDCSSYVSWVLYEYGYEEFKGGQVTSGGFLDTNWNELYGWEEIEVGSGENPIDQLQPGDIFVRHGEGTHHVTFVVEVEDGKIYCYDCGNEANWRGTSGSSVTRNGVLMKDATYFLTKAGEGKIIRIEDAKNNTGSAYEGYLGNEAVVSPVTGVLLEYGTYETEKDSITGEEYRVNTDLLNPSDDSEPETVSDKVGYAKILVLDAENYKKLESSTSNAWKNSSLLNEKTKVNSDGDVKITYDDDLDSEEDLEDTDKWDALNKTVYGYKQFAEAYETAGISGYIVYIDGFICEEVDEEFTEEDLESKIPNEGSSDAAITKDDFTKITEDDLKGQTEVLTSESNEDVVESKYEKDETYKMASEKATDKANAEAIVKEQANSTIKITADGEDLIFIKEGTVLGRTMTDYELITEIRDESEEKYKEYRTDGTTTDPETGELEEDKVMGNYIRIIFKDTDDTVVENVEDYMKLDDGEVSSSPVEFEQLAYFVGCLEEGFYKTMDNGNSYGVEVLKDNAGNTTAFGLTSAVANTVKDSYPDFASHLSSGSVPKTEAQDVFILVLEAAKEEIESKVTVSDLDDNYLFALMDLHHASPAKCYTVIDILNSNGTLTIQDFADNWGSNKNYEELLKRRGYNRGVLATEGRFLLYQEGSEGDEVIFDTETPWTEFCDGGGTFELTQESSGFYHIEKDAYTASDYP